jgi:hypothetical protein
MEIQSVGTQFFGTQGPLGPVFYLGTLGAPCTQKLRGALTRERPHRPLGKSRQNPYKQSLFGELYYSVYIIILLHYCILLWFLTYMYKILCAPRHHHYPTPAKITHCARNGLAFLIGSRTTVGQVVGLRMCGRGRGSMHYCPHANSHLFRLKFGDPISICPCTWDEMALAGIVTKFC